MSAASRRSEASRGFTLIEISVVMLLFGLVLALVIPALSGAYARLAERSELRRIETAIATLPLTAYALREEGTLAELAAAHLELPGGWSISGAESIYIRANGLCSGGTLRLNGPAGERSLILDAPFCEPAAEP